MRENWIVDMFVARLPGSSEEELLECLRVCASGLLSAAVSERLRIATLQELQCRKAAGDAFGTLSLLELRIHQALRAYEITAALGKELLQIAAGGRAPAAPDEPSLAKVSP